MSLKMAMGTTKGGSGKSTLAVLMAGEFDQRSMSVTLIDADPQRTIMQWHGKCLEKGTALQNLKVIELRHQNDLVDHMQDAATDVVIVDVQGSSNALLGIAAVNADIIVVPCNASAFDVNEVMKLPGFLRSYTATQKVPTPYRVVMNGVSGIEFKLTPFRSAVQQLLDAKIIMIQTVVSRRHYYKVVAEGLGSLYKMAETPDNREARRNAIDNINKMLRELVDADEEVRQQRSALELGGGHG